MFVLPLCLFSPLSASPHVSASVLLSLESLREPLAPPKASHSCSGPPQGHRPPSQKTHLTSLLMWATLFPQWNRRAWAHVTTDSAAAGGAKTQSSFCVLVALWVMGSRWAVRTDGGLGEPVCWLGSARGGLFTEELPGGRWGSFMGTIVTSPWGSANVPRRSPGRICVLLPLHTEGLGMGDTSHGVCLGGPDSAWCKGVWHMSGTQLPRAA